MANKESVSSANVQSSTKKKVKYIRNRSNSRVELIVEGKVKVFLPGSTTEVPENFVIPEGIGLFVK